MVDVTSQEDLRVQALNFEDKWIVHGVILHMQIRSSNQTIRKRQKAVSKKQKAEGVPVALVICQKLNRTRSVSCRFPPRWGIVRRRRGSGDAGDCER